MKGTLFVLHLILIVIVILILIVMRSRLRLICNEASDYAKSSPIEPSVAGGGKIARAIRRAVTDPDFGALGSRVFGRA